MSKDTIGPQRAAPKSSAAISAEVNQAQQFLNPPKGGRNPFKRFKAKGRNLPGHRKGEMNSTEEKYAREILDPLKSTGEILHYEFESVTLKLAKLASWNPDFMALYADGTIEFVDVKGSNPAVEQAQRVKVKIAAEKFWMFRFVVAQMRTKKDGGGFNREEL